ncbi:MAG TPA: hypothetical protein DHV83_00415 [Prevotella sp.]|jgi:hypothetical protein|uniref:hypothetical protein n=1 Tax=Hallella absiana TaxID=2925336 RepID=UPI000EB88422|nr:hypothetical protein [Hallella absiana]HCJ46022.1 hypothetical protein [Prevotella sp.]
MPQQVIKFNQAQRDVLNVVSLLKSDEDVKALRKVLIDFVNNRLQQELDKLWDSDEWSEEKLQQMSKENLRTHYEEP